MIKIKDKEVSLEYLNKYIRNRAWTCRKVNSITLTNETIDASRSPYIFILVKGYAPSNNFKWSVLSLITRFASWIRK